MASKTVRVDHFVFGNSVYYKLSPVRGRADLTKQRFHRHKLTGAHGYKTKLSAEAMRDVWGGKGRAK